MSQVGAAESVPEKGVVKRGTSSNTVHRRRDGAARPACQVGDQNGAFREVEVSNYPNYDLCQYPECFGEPPSYTQDYAEKEPRKLSPNGDAFSVSLPVQLLREHGLVDAKGNLTGQHYLLLEIDDDEGRVVIDLGGPE